MNSVNFGRGHMRHLTLIFAGILSLTAGSASQERADDTKPLNDGVATVYVYRKDYDPFIYSFVFSRTMSVKFAEADGAPKELPKIAKLHKNRYLILKLKPGSYLFDTREMEDKLRLDVKAGEERYLRFDQGYQCPSEDPDPNGLPTCEERPAGIFEMSEDDGRRELAKMKPIGKADVLKPNLVTIPIKK